MAFSSHESFLPGCFNAANVASNLYTEKLLEALSFEYAKTSIEFICMKSFQLEPQISSLIRRRKHAVDNESGFQTFTHLKHHSFNNSLLALKVIHL
jgi:hypothetical protein